MPRLGDDLLPYYHRELTYLREQGAHFARKHPKVAHRLELGVDEIPDPHVERLMEAFAFLTARIQHKIDDDFPEIPGALLGLVHPQFTCPVPSMAIAEFSPDPSRGDLSDGFTVPKSTEIFAQTTDGLTCRFRTGYPTTLWPLEVREARFERTDRYRFLDQRPEVLGVLRLRLSTSAGSMAELSLDDLRVYLHGYRSSVHELYEMLCTNSVGIAVHDGDRVQLMPEAHVRSVGFGADEDLLPYPPTVQSAYRLVHEYVAFPEKFLFVDLSRIRLASALKEVDVLVLLNRTPRERLRVDESNFRLGCTPVVNLFNNTTEPVRITQERTEYRLEPDIHRGRTTEIHSVLRVSAIPPEGGESRVVTPFFSFDHEVQARDQRAFWYVRREPVLRADMPGSQLLLAFLDLDFNPALPSEHTVFAHTLCTNRDLAEQLAAGEVMQVELDLPAAPITLLTKPTPQVDPPLQGKALWRLISHLSLNYLSLTEGEESLKSLREILRLYDFSRSLPIDQVAAGLRKLECREVVRRVGDEAWRGFRRGIELTLTFDETQYVGISAFMLASVLNRVFALYAPVNSFTELVILSEQRQGIWKRWPPMAGDQPVL